MRTFKRNPPPSSINGPLLKGMLLERKFNDELFLFTGVIGAICFIIVLVIIGLIFYCRDKGDYETKEAKGADIAENADVAVVFNQTGVPDITKRQEFFM